MKIRVSVINYANTLPFIYGLQKSEYIQKNSEFTYHYPAQGVASLKNNEVDISIIPIVAINEIPNNSIITNFCISALGKVDSVLLCSSKKLTEITQIEYDKESRTSNKLVTHLCNKVWGINPEFVEPGSNAHAKVIIGDKAFEQAKDYEYIYDLAEAWTYAYSKPFVFACWVANKDIPKEYIQEFNKALEYGVKHIQESILNSEKKYIFNIQNYLTTKIQYDFGNTQKDAMNFFLEQISL